MRAAGRAINCVRGFFSMFWRRTETQRRAARIGCATRASKKGEQEGRACSVRDREVIAKKCTAIHIFPQRGHFPALMGIRRMSEDFLVLGWPMLFATVSRGRKAGMRLLPHLFHDNRYRVQLGKAGPYIPVTDYREIPSYLANGYSLLMSDRAGKQPPSLISPQSVRGWTKNSEELFFPARGTWNFSSE
jgi:hypothetical protein